MLLNEQCGRSCPPPDRYSRSGPERRAAREESPPLTLARSQLGYLRARGATAPVSMSRK